MSYNPLPTVATGDYWTAGQHNTYVKDNFGAGVPDLFAAAGDMVLGSGLNSAVRLPVGSARGILNIEGSAPAWSDAPHCILTRSSAQTISNATETAVTFDIETTDTDGFHSAGAFSNRITIPTGLGGYYLVQAVVEWAALAGNSRELYLRKNGGKDLGHTRQGQNTVVACSIQGVLYLSAGDYIDLMVYQTSGGNTTILQQNGTPHFSAMRLL